jgi:hypothetical protein
MGYYLLDNPPVVQQFYSSRPRPLTGGVLVHTTESIMDDVGPDTGAENVASYIARRTGFGSYHVIVDQDSIVDLLPDSYVAYHCAQSGYNGVTWGISLACRSTDLDVNDGWTQRALGHAAMAISAFWRRNGIDPVAAAAFIPAIETQSRAGMTTHGDAQPSDRSDAWTRHPQRAELEALLISNIKTLSLPTPPGVDPIMNKPVMMRRQTDGTISVFYQGTPFRVDCRPKDVQMFQYFGVEWKGNADPWFWEITQAVKVG